MKFVLPICLLVVFSSTVYAEKNTEISPVLAKPGTVVLEDDFDRAELGAEWKGVKGEWKIADGGIVAKELEADKHAAVMNFHTKNRNSIVRLSFKFDGSTSGFHFSLNHAKGHLFRVLVSEKSLMVRTDADKKDKTIKSEMIGQAKGKFEKGKWYTLQVEMVGDKVVAMTDNGLKVSGQHARLDADKPGYRLVMRGDSLSVDDIKIWSVK